MRILNVSYFKYLLLVAVVFTVSCFKNPGDEKTPVLTNPVPVSAVYMTKTPTELAELSYLWAEGECYGNKSVTFTYESPYTAKRSVDAMCVKSKVAIKLPVIQGDKDQLFKIEMSARLGAKKSKPITVALNYVPPPANGPGFAVLNGGGHVGHATANVSTMTQIGEPWSYTTVPSATGARVPVGLDGAIGAIPY
jgi:hypothetical protein